MDKAKVNKSKWIREQPDDLSAADIVERGAKEGIRLTPAQVYTARANAKRTSGTTISVTRSAEPVEGDLETQLRTIVRRIGTDRASQILGVALSLLLVILPGCATVDGALRDVATQLCDARAAVSKVCADGDKEGACAASTEIYDATDKLYGAAVEARELGQDVEQHATKLHELLTQLWGTIKSTVAEVTK